MRLWGLLLFSTFYSVLKNDRLYYILELHYEILIKNAKLMTLMVKAGWGKNSTLCGAQRYLPWGYTKYTKYK